MPRPKASNKSAPPPRRRQSVPSSQTHGSTSAAKPRAKLTVRRSDAYYPRPIPVERTSSRDAISLLSSDDAIEEVVSSAKGKFAAFR